MEMSLKLDDATGNLPMVVRENWARLGCGRGRTYCLEHASIPVGLLTADRPPVTPGFFPRAKMGRNLRTLSMIMRLDLLLLLVSIEIDGTRHRGEWLGSRREEQN